jgi:3-(3-hydroxy-phenyl)propionate hydroxylase
LAVRLGGLINAKAMEAAVPGVGLEGGGAAQMASIKPRLCHGLSAGWGGVAGEISRQPQLQDGVRLDDHVGYGFAAILRPEFASGLPGHIFEQFALRGITHVVADAPGLAAWLQDIGAPAVLVRPDRYMLGEAHSVRELQALTSLV